MGFFLSFFSLLILLRPGRKILMGVKGEVVVVVGGGLTFMQKK